MTYAEVINELDKVPTPRYQLGLIVIIHETLIVAEEYFNCDIIVLGMFSSST